MLDTLISYIAFRNKERERQERKAAMRKGR